MAYRSRDWAVRGGHGVPGVPQVRIWLRHDYAESVVRNHQSNKLTDEQVRAQLIELLSDGWSVFRWEDDLIHRDGGRSTADWLVARRDHGEELHFSFRGSV